MTPEIEALCARLEAKVEIETWYDGGYRPIALLNPDGPEAAAKLREMADEVERLRKIERGQWFYPADGWDQDCCFYSPDEVIDYIDPEPGDHVIEVNVATSLPSIWCAVRVTADEDADERYTYTEHRTETDARAALAGGSHG